MCNKLLCIIVHHIKPRRQPVRDRGVRLAREELEQPLDRRRADAPRLGQRRAQRVVRRRRRIEAPPQRRPGPANARNFFSGRLADPRRAQREDERRERDRRRGARFQRRAARLSQRWRFGTVATRSP